MNTPHGTTGWLRPPGRSGLRVAPVTFGDVFGWTAMPCTTVAQWQEQADAT